MAMVHLVRELRKPRNHERYGRRLGGVGFEQLESRAMLSGDVVLVADTCEVVQEGTEIPPSPPDSGALVEPPVQDGAGPLIGPPLRADERPIIEYLLRSTEDYETESRRGDPESAQQNTADPTVVLKSRGSGNDAVDTWLADTSRTAGRLCQPPELWVTRSNEAFLENGLLGYATFPWMYGESSTGSGSLGENNWDSLARPQGFFWLR